MIPEEAHSLSRALAELATAVYATKAFVFDAWGLVWCESPKTDDHQPLFEQIRRVLDRDPPLHRGGRIDEAFFELDPPVYCRSFASVYVLGLWLTRSSDLFLLKRALRTRLPKIEALTLALPPPGGSGPTSGAGHGSA